MNKLLKIQLLVVVALLFSAVLIRVGVLDSAAADIPQSPNLSAETTEKPVEQPPESTADTTPDTTPETTQPLIEPEQPAKLTFGEGFTPVSRDYFVYDLEADNLMAISGDPDEKIYPASVTKLFTAYVALQYLDPDTTVTLGREVYMVAGDSSLAYVKPKQKITVSRLIEGMLLPSGNDAAYGLAVAAAKAKSGNSSMEPADALAYFVDMMNDTAQTLGMTGSHFANPDGYHDVDHYTSCADLITIAKLALNNELILQYASTVKDRVTFSNGDIANWNNSNHMIDPEHMYYQADAIGLKTGHTNAAGYCLLSAFQLDGNYIIIGTFGGSSPDDRYTDTLALYDMVLEVMAE